MGVIMAPNISFDVSFLKQCKMDLLASRPFNLIITNKDLHGMGRKSTTVTDGDVVCDEGLVF